MLYTEPKNMLQLKINEALESNEESVISDLVKLSLMKKALRNQDNLVYTEIYNLLGLEKFTELVSLMDGKTITFPTKEEFKDIIITVLCYYYRNIENKDWSEVKTLLGIKDINTIKQGIHANQFETYLNELINKRLK